MTRIKRIFRKLAIAAAIFVVFVTLVYCVATLVNGWRLENRIADLRQSGQPVSYSDLEKSVPDNENAAVLLKRAISEIEAVKKAAEPAEDKTDFSVYSLPAPGTREDTPRNWSMVRKSLESHKKVIPLIRQSVELPQCQIAIVNKYEVLFPIFAGFRNASRILRAEAVISAMDGRIDEAVDALDAGYKLAAMENTIPLFIEHLTHMAMFAISSKALQEVVHYADLNDNHLRRLYDTLSAVNIKERYTRALQGERVFGLIQFQMYSKAPVKPIIYADEIAYINLYDQQIKASQYHYQEARKKGLLSNESELPPIYHPLTRVMAPMFRRVALNSDKGAAEVAGSRIYLAILAYRNRFGAYPADLEDVRTKLGWEIPEDPFTGKDFIYKKRGNGFILYSIGTDLKDDGGTQDEIQREKGSADRGDLVWRKV